MKIIYGYNVDYLKLLDNGTVETLKERRTKASLSFTLKAVNLPRFHYWFQEAPATYIEVRPTTRKEQPSDCLNYAAQ